MAYAATQPKTHYRSNSIGLFCSGRSSMYVTCYVTSKLDEVTCGSCRRKIIARAKKGMK
jgi:hypothetical protein